MLIQINGKLTKPNQAKISVLSTAFLYGQGVFETLRTYGNKRIFQTTSHLKRLAASAKALEIKLPPLKTIEQNLQTLVQKSPHKLQRLKIIAIQDHIIIISTQLTEEPSLQTKGVKCTTTNCIRSFPQIKSTSYLNSYLPHKQAEKTGYYDAILLDKNQKVLEGAYSNIFWFEEQTLCTPNENILHGITRQIILQISPFKIRHKTITLKNLLSKKEIFLTQTTRSVVPIIQIDKTLIADGKPGPNTKHLIALFAAFSQNK